jgi:hypothetical protein
MEEVPTPPLDTPDRRELFTVIRRMMAKSPDDRFQTADELAQLLDGGQTLNVNIATAPTKAIPSLGGPKLATAPTTPLPRVPGAPPTPPPMPIAADAKHSVLATVFLWLFIVGSVLGGGGLYAYNQGWLLPAAVAVRPDSTHGTPVDSLAPHTDSTASTSRDTATAPAGDTSRAHLPTAGVPGKLTLVGVPNGAAVTLNGQPVKGAQIDVPPGVYKLAVRMPGFDTYERQIVMTPSAATAVRVELQRATGAGGGGGETTAGPCDQYGPAYNQDNICFDTRPVPLSSTVVPVPGDVPVVPREAILLFHVSHSGETIETRMFVRSNVDTFNDQALDLARTLRWNPAQKNGEPVDAWVQWPFKPVRQ